MTDIEKAKKIFSENDYTIVLVCGDTVYTSRETGVRPMLDFIDNKTKLDGFSVADKIVGKAAAMLFLLVGVCEVYSPVMSKSAVEALDKYGIKHTEDVVTEKIINRKGDDVCPMEKAVANTQDAHIALLEIKKKLEMLRSDKNGN